MQMFCRRQAFARNRNTVFQLRFAVFVVSVYEHLKHSLQGIKTSVKATATARKSGDVMPKVCVDAFNNVRITLVTDITNVSARENNIKVGQITIRAIIFRIYGIIYDALQSERTFIELNIKTDDLPRFAANHRHNIGVFTGFSPCFFVYEPK